MEGIYMLSIYIYLYSTPIQKILKELGGGKKKKN